MKVILLKDDPIICLVNSDRVQRLFSNDTIPSGESEMILSSYKEIIK